MDVDHDPHTDHADRGLEHAWAWFQLHANQRLQMVNFWLLSVAFLTAAFVGAMTNSQPNVGLGVAVTGAAVTVCFYRLERRTRQLVRIAERAVADFERDLATLTGVEELKIVALAESEKARFGSYGVVIRALQWFAIAAWLAAAVGAAWSWLKG